MPLLRCSVCCCCCVSVHASEINVEFYHYTKLACFSLDGSDRHSASHPKHKLQKAVSVQYSSESSHTQPISLH